MLKQFPIPIGADKISVKAIQGFKEKLGHLVISKAEIQFIIDGVMKAQIPRDQEKARKEAEKKAEKLARRQASMISRRSLS